MPNPTTSVHEIRHEVRIELTDAPQLTNLSGRRRKPIGIHLTYGLRRDITRVDIAIQWEDEAQLWSRAHEMPDWLSEIIDEHLPRDVDEPEDGRPTGAGGWPIDAEQRATTWTPDTTG